MTSPRRAFTLTELLVVLGIIALLAAIAFPVISGVRNRAQTTTCLSNVKQYALAMQAYTQDYDGNYPLITTAIHAKGHAEDTPIEWYDLLLPYMKGKSLYCPLRELREGEIETVRTVGYAMNSNLNGGVPLQSNSEYNVGKNEARVSYQSRLVTVFDSRVSTYATGGPDLELGRSDEKSRKLTEGYRRHNGGANYAFADGHAKWHQLSAFVGQLKDGQIEFSCTEGKSYPCFTP